MTKEQLAPKSMKLAILDMYNGTPNLGMKSIKAIVDMFPEFEYTVYDVRGNCELPGLDYDVYICSGGPGSPLEREGLWIRAFSILMDKLWNFNNMYDEKKHVFFICHSFQMICNHFGLGDIVPRKSRAFGIFPVHKTEDGKKEILFQGLDDPFYAADFRDWQFIQPNQARVTAMGAEVLAIEKKRDHVPLERAIMAVRFSKFWFGVQFHPEATSDGMLRHLQVPERKEDVITHHGVEKYDEIIQLAGEKEKLDTTRKLILPRFLEQAIRYQTAFSLHLS
jgi:GMP synthase-like glutamine amidotransferase